MSETNTERFTGMDDSKQPMGGGGGARSNKQITDHERKQVVFFSNIGVDLARISPEKLDEFYFDLKKAFPPHLLVQIQGLMNALWSNFDPDAPKIFTFAPDPAEDTRLTSFGYEVLGPLSSEERRIIEQLEKISLIAARENIATPEGLGDELIAHHLRELSVKGREEARTRWVKHFHDEYANAQSRLDFEKLERESVRTPDERKQVILLTRFAIGLKAKSPEKIEDFFGELHQQFPMRIVTEIRDRMNNSELAQQLRNSGNRGK